MCRKTWRKRLARLVAVAGVLAAGSVSLAQTPTFTGVGQLGGGTSSKCLGVSADGTLIVGEAVDSNGKTVAVLYDRVSGSPTLVSLGFTDATNQETRAADVGTDGNATVHVAGQGRNASNHLQAFHWSGNRAGTGSYFLIPYLPNSNATPQSFGRSLAVDPTNTVFIAGESSSSSATENPPNNLQAFRYRSDNQSVLALGFLGGGSKRSIALGMNWHNGATDVVGWSWSKFGGGNNQPEAFIYNSASGGSMGGDKNLDWVCGGEYWQIAAGDNGTAETAANGDNIQIHPVGTSGLNPNDVVVSCGPDNQLKDQVNPSGDDITWPVGSSPTTSSASRYNAVSPDGRYRVGRSTYPGSGLFEAHLRDIRNRDYNGNDNCGGIGFHWPLGFLPGDNYSEAYGVSNSAAIPSREGLVVTGWSRHTPGSGFDNDSRAFVCFMTDGPDLYWLKHRDALPGDNGAAAATRYKGMLDLKEWLISKGIDMTGWNLWEGRAVSDDGKVIVGWGIHNGVTEGFVVTIEPPPPTGACCVKTGLGTGTCSEISQEDCQSTPGGTWNGPGSVCGVDNANCDFCPPLFADPDEDGDVDLDDFAYFQRCYTGPGGGVPTGCSCFDRFVDSPAGIDDDDLVKFTDCVTGPEVLFALNPPPACVP